jgi:hypothetical protein
MAPGFGMQDYKEGGKGIETEFWSRLEGWAFAHYIIELPPLIAKMLKAEAPLYRPAFSKTTQTTYWANDCPSCKVLQGDFNLFEEPGGAFFPMSVEQVRKMKASRLPVPFDALGEPSFAIREADLIPGIASPQTGRRRDAEAERPGQTIFVKPPIGQRTSSIGAPGGVYEPPRCADRHWKATAIVQMQGHRPSHAQFALSTARAVDPITIPGGAGAYFVRLPPLLTMAMPKVRMALYSNNVS